MGAKQASGVRMLRDDRIGKTQGRQHVAWHEIEKSSMRRPKDCWENLGCWASHLCSSLYHHHLPLPVRCDVWRLWARDRDAVGSSLDGPQREALACPEDRQRGGCPSDVSPRFLEIISRMLKMCVWFALQK